MHHQLKLNEEFWDAVMSGEKNFEVRNNDREFKKGDTVVFNRVTEHGTTYELSKPFEITYVLSGWAIKEDFVAFGIKRIEETSECKK